MEGIASLLGAGISAGIQGAAAEGQQHLTQDQLDLLRDKLNKIEGIQEPDLAYNLQAPQQYGVNMYGNPESYGAGQQVSIDPQDRMKQMAALDKLQGVVSGAANAELNANSYNALNNAARQSQGREAAIMQNLASRGVAGSGLELAMKQQAVQNSANNSRQGLLEAAKNNALMRLQGIGEYNQGMGNLRNQDTALASKNADIINQFNMANVANRNRTNEMNTGLMNQRDWANVGQGNDYARRMADMKYQGNQQSFADELAKRGSAAGQAQNLAQTAISAGNQNAAAGINIGSTIGQGVGNAANSAFNAWKPSGSGTSSDDSSGFNLKDPTDEKNGWGYR